MRLLARPRVAGAFLVLGLFLGVPSTQGGIVITSTKVQPVQDPYYEVYFNLTIQPNTTVNALDNVYIDSIPYIGDGGSNLVKVYPPLSGAFLNVFDDSSSPFFDSFVFEVDPANMSLEIVYTGYYDGKIQSIMTGATGLVVPLDTVGVETIDFPSDVPYSELVTPLNYTSTTNGVTLTGTVVPFVIPEPATAIALLSGLPLVFLALRRARTRAA